MIMGLDRYEVINTYVGILNNGGNIKLSHMEIIKQVKEPESYKYLCVNELLKFKEESHEISVVKH